MGMSEVHRSQLKQLPMVEQSEKKDKIILDNNTKYKMNGEKSEIVNMTIQ